MAVGEKMQQHLMHGSIVMLIGALLLLSFSAQAARRNQCNNNLIGGETQLINFGEFSPTIGGSVTVAPDGSLTATGVTPLGGTVQAGIITITTTLANCHCYPLRIRVLDGNATLVSGANNMAMSNVVTSPATADAATIGSAAGSSLQINVGADLAVGAAQAAGTYNTAGDTYGLRIRFLPSPTSGNQCP